MPDVGQDLLEFFKGKTPEQIQEILTGLADKFHVTVGNVVDTVKNAGDAVGTAVNKAGSTIKGVVGEAEDDIQDFTKNAKNYFSGLGETLGLTDESVVKLAKAVAYLGVEYEALTRLPPPQSFKSLNSLISDTDNTTGSLADNVSDLIHILNIPEGSGVANVLKTIAQNADNVRTAESAFVQTAAASGQLNEVLGETGNDFDQLSRKMVAYSTMNTDIALATGLSTAQVEKFGSALLQIPGALGANIQGTADGTQNYSLLDAALKTATGSGMSFKDVFGEITDMYNRFGEEGGDNFQKSLQYVSMLQDAVNKLKIPLQFVKQYTDQAASSFKFFGNNSEAAIRMVERLGPALKAAKLGPEAIKELVSDITENIAGMGLAQRSFLNQQAGGAGGLRGGYEVELLKKQGKFDEIQKMAETALRKQFGGRIVTLDEAAKDEGAARQLTKQVQLITQGPTKLVNNEAEAYKFFDAMKQGFATPESKSSDALLQENLEKGTEFQERNNTLLTIISANAQKIAANTQMSFNQGIRGVIGPGEGLTSQAQFLREGMGAATYTAAINPLFGPNVGRQPTANENMEDFVNNILQEATSPTEFFNSLMTRGNEIFNQFEVDESSFPKLTFPAAEPGAMDQGTQGVINDQATVQQTNQQTNAQGQPVAINVSATCPECHKKIAVAISDQAIQGYEKGMDHLHHMGSRVG